MAKNRFSHITKSRIAYGKRDSCRITFGVCPFEKGMGLKWKAYLCCEFLFDEPLKFTIGTTFTDFDVLYAMERAQKFLIATQQLCDIVIDATDDLWREIVTDLEKQFGFSLS